MTFEVVAAAPGRPAFEALAAAIDKAKVGDALAPVTVVVPANDVGLSTRRRLARAGGIAAISFVTPYRLAEILGATTLAATGRVPVSTPVLLCHVRQVLRRAPGIFERVARHQTTELSLLRAHQTLSDLTPAELDVLAAQSPRAASTVAIHRQVLEATRSRYFAEHDLAEAAIETVGSDPTVTAELGRLIVHLPQSMANAHCRLIAALADLSAVTVIVSLTGRGDADEAVGRTLLRLGATTPASPTSTVERPIDVRSYTDPDDEIRSVVRALVGDLHSGTQLCRIGVFHPTAGPYHRLVRDHLTAAGIEHHGTAVHSLGQSATARFLTGLLALADDFSRARLTGWLATLPILDPEGHLIATERWEPISRDAGIVAGRDQWLTRLARHRDRLCEQRDRLDEDSRGWIDRELHHLDSLEAFVAELGETLDAARGLTRWSAIAEWAVGQVTRYLGNEPVRGATWPADEIELGDAVLDICGRLGSLDGVEPVTDLDVFGRTLAHELDAALVPTGRFGRGVMIGPARSATAADLDVVYVVGMAEGLMPSHPADDPLLPDRERRSVGGALPLVSSRIGDEHRWLHDAIAAGSRRVVMTTPRGDLRRSTRRYPSRWLPEGVITSQASHPSGVEAADPPGSLQEWGMQLVRRHATPFDSNPLAAEDPVFARGEAVVTSRAGEQLTRFDGNVAGGAIPSPTTGRVSATRLETWARCPHAYLMTHVLHLTVAEAPQDELAMTAMAKGTLFHEAVHAFVSGRLGRPHGVGWDGDDLVDLLAIGDALLAAAEAAGAAGRPTLAKAEQWRLRSQLREFHRRDTQRLQEQRLQPLASELSFGLPGAPFEPVPFSLADGRVLHIRGAIDRVDAGEDGRLVVTDYKTGSARRFDGIEDDPELDGTHLQLQIYAHAARTILGRPDTPVRSQYWFTSSREGWKTPGYEFDQERESRFREVVSGLVAGIETGFFPHRPEEPTSFRPFVECHWCDPDGLGTVDRWEEAERKSTSASRARFVPALGGGDG